VATGTVEVKVENLSASIKALSKVDKGLRKEVGAVIRKESIYLKNTAYARMQTGPGKSGSYPITKGAYIRTASATKGMVGFKTDGSGRNAAIMGAEFGAHTWHVPRGRSGQVKGVGQGSMQRRTFPVWRGNSTTIRGTNGPGWILLPLLRKEVPLITERLEAAIADVFLRSAKSSGVKRLVS
jgi:hypothetical protein